MIHEEGMGAVLSRHFSCATALRAGLFELGFTLLPDGDRRSCTVFVVCPPDGLPAGEIVSHMRARHHTAIAGGTGKLKERVIRIGTMGTVNAKDILTDLAQLEATLTALGRQVPNPGAAAHVAGRLLMDRVTVRGNQHPAC